MNTVATIITYTLSRNYRDGEQTSEHLLLLFHTILPIFSLNQPKTAWIGAGTYIFHGKNNILCTDFLFSDYQLHSDYYTFK